MSRATTSSITETVATLNASPESPLLRIRYPSTTITRAGTRVAKADAAPSPTLLIAASALPPAPVGQKYLAVAIDLDAPFTSFPVLGPVLHGMQADLVPGVTDEDSFVALEEQAEGAKQWSVARYGGPGPPPMSGPHRYFFLVYAQPEAVGNSEAIRNLLGFPNELGMTSRMRWNLDAFQTKLGLGKVLAGNYFLSSF
jgi:phosphatidylethanolamine-binding protein (PEBP) family uncharacterized protein